jgi:cytochrome c biogenesis protein CcdA
VETPSIVLTFVAGILTVVTPCIITILPAMLAGSSGNRFRPVAIVAGMTLTFTMMGVAISALGAAFSSFESVMRWFALSFIIGMGAVLYDEDINHEYVKVTSHLARLIGEFFGKNNPVRFKPDKNNGIIGGFTLGTSLGILWIPCVGPILGSVLAFVSMESNMKIGALLLLTYSLGVGIPMLVIAYTGRSVSSRLEWFARNSYHLRKLAGAILMALGIAMLFGIDKWLQSVLLPYFPVYI